MRPDFIAEVILARTEDAPISKNLEKALLEQHGAIPEPLQEPLPEDRFSLVPRLLHHYFPKITFARTPLIAHFDTMHKTLIWVPLVLTFLSAVMVAGAWIAGADLLWRIALFIVALLCGALMKWTLSLGVRLAYILIDSAKPGNLIVFLLGKERSVTSTFKTGRVGLLSGDEIDLKFHNLKELIINKVLWRRPNHDDRMETHILVIVCCLHALEHAEFTIQKEVVLERYARSLSYLKINNEDPSLTYLEMLLNLERGEYREMKQKVDYLLSMESTFEVKLYQEALNFILSHPENTSSASERAD